MMKINRHAISLLAFASVMAMDAKVTGLRCEYLENPIGIDTGRPRLSWEFSDRRTEGEYSVEISDNRNFKDFREFKCGSTRSAIAEIDSTPGKKYYWRVVRYTPDGKMEKSVTATFETGKFTSRQWAGKWISDNHDINREEAPVFRHTFTLSTPAHEARAYISALGYYDMYVNGIRVGDHHLDPGFTGYDKRSLYVTHDISGLLRKGDNEIRVTLGNGFANCQSRDAWGQEKAPWRSRPSFILEITADGRTVAQTDANWETALSPVVYNNLYSGEHFDARKKPADWTAAKVVNAPNNNLKWQSMPAIRPVKALKGMHLQSFGDTIHVYDMGMNIAGVCRLDVKGERGTKIEMAHGELLKGNGRLEQGNLDIYYHPLKEDEAFQTDVYIIGETGKKERFQPQFTYHGFRYVEIRSTRPVKASDIELTGLLMRTAIPRTGSFRCSNPVLNRIYAATMLSYEDNLHSIPTDCPQREKNGWTADAHVAVDLGLLNYDGITFYEKWMNDFIDNQKENGNIAGIIPSAGWGYGDSPGPVWDAALFIIPTALYDYYGDKTAMERLYPTMLRYMDWLESLKKEDGTLACGIGDWLPYKTQTPTDFTSTLYAFADYKMMARICSLIGKDSVIWEQKGREMKERINRKWFDREKALYANGSQAAQAISLYWDIVPEGYAEKVAGNLNDMVAANGYALDFGLLGSKSVLRMLTRYGYHDTAIRMATRTEAPSWGHWTEECGQTTLAETWTMSPEFRDASLNHAFFGDIAAWMTQDIAGLNFDPKNPGFRHIIIRPVPMEGIDWAEATYKSVNGEIATRWERNADGSMSMDITVPYGCSASVCIGDNRRELGGGRHKIRM